MGKYVDAHSRGLGTGAHATRFQAKQVIVGLFTEMLSPGGVQRAGRHVAAVVSEFASEHGVACRFLSLNDPQGLHTVRVGPSEFSVSGYARSKSQFVFAAMRAAGRKPSLVIALHPHLAPILWMMKARSRKFRSIVFAHGIEVWQPLGWPRGAALRQADLLIGPSADTVQHLISDQRVDAAKVQCHLWGLDPEFEARVAERVPSALPRDLPANARIILTVSRWDPADRYKGGDTLIAALPRVLRRVPDAFLVLVGDGEDRPRLQQMVHDLGVSDRVRFLHGLTQDELFACYANCQVFALPSRGEGFGFVYLEAMAFGKPVIGGAHGGALDVIEDGVSGCLVPHGDIERLSGALEMLLADPVRAAQMGACGQDRLARKFSFGQFRTQLTHLLEGVLTDKH